MTEDKEMDAYSVPADAEILEAVSTARELYEKLSAATKEYERANREYMAAQSRVIELLRGPEDRRVNYATGGNVGGNCAASTLGQPSLSRLS